MFKGILWSLLFIVGLFLIYFFALSPKTPTLIVNMWNEDTLPKHFRMATTPLISKNEQLPSQKGLDNLNASGSAQFSEGGLNALLKKISSKNVTIVDLRQESHGFINGIAVSWYGKNDWANIDKTLAQIQTDEKQRLDNALSQSFILVYASKRYPIPLYVKNVATESEIVKAKDYGYFRLPVTDHRKPSDNQVDEFIRFVESLPKDTWLHFHCAAGEGRTTTLLAMYDMMHNAADVTFEDILKRQKLLGGIDLLAASPNEWKYPYEVERAEFIKKFYQYCKDNPQYQKTWSAWIESHK